MLVAIQKERKAWRPFWRGMTRWPICMQVILTNWTVWTIFSSMSRAFSSVFRFSVACALGPQTAGCASVLYYDFGVVVVVRLGVFGHAWHPRPLLTRQETRQRSIADLLIIPSSCSLEEFLRIEFMFRRHVFKCSGKIVLTPFTHHYMRRYSADIDHLDYEIKFVSPREA